MIASDGQASSGSDFSFSPRLARSRFSSRFCPCSQPTWTRVRRLAKLDDDWSKAAATRDADRVASFYAEDAIAYPPNEPVAIGRAAAKKVWASYFADVTFSISWKAVHAEVAKSGDLGYTAGTYEASFKGPDGKQVSEKGKYVCTWRKQKGGTGRPSTTFGTRMPSRSVTIARGA